MGALWGRETTPLILLRRCAEVNSGDPRPFLTLRFDLRHFFFVHLRGTKAKQAAGGSAAPTPAYLRMCLQAVFCGSLAPLGGVTDMKPLWTESTACKRLCGIARFGFTLA